MTNTRRRRRPPPRNPGPILDLSTMEPDEMVQATLVRGKSYAVRDFGNPDPTAMIRFEGDKPKPVTVRTARYLERTATDLVDLFKGNAQEPDAIVSGHVSKFEFAPLPAEPIPAPADAEEAEEEEAV